MSDTVPAIFKEPPQIPEGLTDLMRYKFEMNQYKLRIKSTTWIFLELIGTLLVLGVIWINVDWVKAVVTTIAIFIVLILLIVLSHLL